MQNIKPSMENVGAIAAAQLYCHERGKFMDGETLAYTEHRIQVFYFEKILLLDLDFEGR